MRKITICISITVLFVFLTKAPRLLFKAEVGEYSNATIYRIVFTFLLILGAAFILDRNLRLGCFTFQKLFHLHKPWMFFLPVLYPGIWAISGFSEECFSSTFYITATITVLLLKGISEEVIFRGLIQEFLIKETKWKYSRIFFTTSVLFSSSHLGNLLTSDIYSVINQIVYAFFMGLLFSVIAFRTGNFWLLGITHGVLNFLFSVCKGSNQQHYINTESGTGLLDVVESLLSLAVVFVPVLVLYKILMHGLKKRRT